MLRLGLLAGLLVALTIDPLAAQQPTEAQRGAIRASCRSDFIANCSGVTPGGKEAFECLVRNEVRLSQSCKTAVNAVAGKPAEPAATPAEPAAPAPSRAESAPQQEPAPAAASGEDALKSVQKACTLSDMAAHCSWIQPNNPEIVLCLKANAADLSPTCQAAVQAAPAPPAAASAPATEPERKAAPIKKAEPERKPAEPERASAPPPAAAAVTKKPTAQQQSAIRAACRSDFISHCSGVTPGGAAALQCLQRNASSLSGGCRSALAAISGGGSAPAAAAGEAAAPAAATPAAAPIGPMPMLRPREALAILRICGADKEAFCSGIPLGGGRLLRCLAENAASVTPSCRAALAAAAGR